MRDGGGKSAFRDLKKYKKTLKNTKSSNTKVPTAPLTRAIISLDKGMNLLNIPIVPKIVMARAMTSFDLLLFIQISNIRKTPSGLLLLYGFYNLACHINTAGGCM